MDARLNLALEQAAIRTFEELCFACTGPWDGTQLPPALVHAAAVPFRGPRDGWLELRLTAETLPTLAASMLGEDAAAPLLQADALGELANVICGNLLPAVGGTDAVFRLGPPGPVPWTTSSPAALALLQFDSGAAELRLHLA